MSYDSSLHPCAHPGCSHWALYNSNACAVHIGFVDEPAAPKHDSPRRGNGRGSAKSPRAGGTVGGHLAGGTVGGPLDEEAVEDQAGARGGLFDLLSFRLACLDRYHRLTLGYRTAGFDDELRTLQVFARIAGRRSAKDAAKDAGAEIDRFLDEVARLAREDPCWKLDNPYGPDSGYKPYITSKPPVTPPSP